MALIVLSAIVALIYLGIELVRWNLRPAAVRQRALKKLQQGSYRR